MLIVDQLTLVFAAPPQSWGKKRVLVIKLDAVGDFILWLDAARELRKLYPPTSHEIVLLGNQAWCDLAAELPHFDHIWPVDRRQFIDSISYRFTLMKKIRQAGFAAAVNPAYSRELFLSDEIVRICGAPDRIGFDGDCTNTSRSGRFFGDRWYTRLIVASPGPLMELARSAEFMRGLGLPDFRATVPDLKGLAGKYATSLPSPYYVIVPGVGVPLKRWPVENFKEVALRIHQMTGWIGIVCGEPGEEALGGALLDGNSIPLKNLVGTTSLPELAGIIAGARIVVGNDSSAIHLAAAVATPAVCLLGGGQYGRFFPYHVEVPTGRSFPVPVFCMMECFGCDWRCSYKTDGSCPAPCISHITVDMVMTQIEKIISGTEPESLI